MSRSDHVKYVNYLNCDDWLIDSVYKWMDSVFKATKKKRGYTKKCFCKK